MCLLELVDTYIRKVSTFFQALVPFPYLKGCSGVAASLQLGQPKMSGIVFEESSTASSLMLQTPFWFAELYGAMVPAVSMSITGQEHLCAAHTTSSGACRLPEPALPGVRGSCLLQPQLATSAPSPTAAHAAPFLQRAMTVSVSSSALLGSALGENCFWSFSTL